MRQFQKSRIKLLEELKDLVTKNLTESNHFLSRDIKRHNRELKGIRKEIVKWIDELSNTKKEEKIENDSATYFNNHQ